MESNKAICHNVDWIGNAICRQISAGIEKFFQDHPDEAGFAFCSAGAVLLLIGSVFYGRRVFS